MPPQKSRTCRSPCSEWPALQNASAVLHAVGSHDQPLTSGPQEKAFPNSLLRSWICCLSSTATEPPCPNGYESRAKEKTREFSRFPDHLSSVISVLKASKFPIFWAAPWPAQPWDCRGRLSTSISSPTFRQLKPQVWQKLLGGVLCRPGPNCGRHRAEVIFQNIIILEPRTRWTYSYLKTGIMTERPWAGDRQVLLFEGEGSLCCSLASPEDIILSKLGGTRTEAGSPNANGWMCRGS